VQAEDEVLQKNDVDMFCRSNFSLSNETYRKLIRLIMNSLWMEY